MCRFIPKSMKSKVATLLWTWIILESGVCSVSFPEITDQRFIDECVREHNRARSSVTPAANNMLYMTWDEDLAITARAWARYCLFEHNDGKVRKMHPTFTHVGENLWAGYPPSSFNVTTSIKGWVDEKEDYDYSSNTCKEICGHYTQVVWADSYKVGCAVQLCPSGVKSTRFSTEEGAIFVCNYGPGGNWRGEKPYKSGGRPCSGCGDTCVDNLCRSKERDSQKSNNNWAPDWDPALTTSGSNYVPILVVRPIALLLTYVAAYAVQHFYPDVFCYE